MRLNYFLFLLRRLRQNLLIPLVLQCASIWGIEFGRFQQLGCIQRRLPGLDEQLASGDVLVDNRLLRIHCVNTFFIFNLYSIRWWIHRFCNSF